MGVFVRSRVFSPTGWSKGGGVPPPRDARSIANGSQRKPSWVHDIGDGIAAGGVKSGGVLPSELAVQPAWGDPVAVGKPAMQGDRLPGGNDTAPQKVGLNPSVVWKRVMRTWTGVRGGLMGTPWCRLVSADALVPWLTWWATGCLVAA